jgi:hypothetical protein
MKKRIHEQINRLQALTDKQKERFLRIYFHGCQHVDGNSTIQSAGAE